MAFPENTTHRPKKDNRFADDGTASHLWGAMELEGANLEAKLGEKIRLSGADYELDEERLDYIRVYTEHVRRLGGVLLVEQRFDLSYFFGPGEKGTGDALVYQPEQCHLHVIDLKYGTGEKVYAKGNEQGLSYMLDARRIALMFGPVERMTFHIVQPRLDHIDEWEITHADLDAFLARAQKAIEESHIAQVLGPESPELDQYLHPAAKTCRWCEAKARCRKLAAFVAEEVKMEFATALADPPPAPPQTDEDLSRAMQVMPLVKQWCFAVEAEVHRRVNEGREIIGTDGKPYKFVEGKKGNRAWADEEAATMALLGVLPPDKAYKPAEIITPAAADKLLNKKATKQTWKDVFEGLIKRADGKAILVQGSDPRPPFQSAAGTDEFDVIEADE